MTLAEIKEAVNKNIEVYYKSSNYVITRSGDEYYIMSLGGDEHTIGLTWMDGITMNGKEEDFFTMRSSEEIIKLLVEYDIESIMNSAKHQDYEFLSNVLTGDGFTQYNNMTAAQLHIEYREMESNKEYACSQ